MKTEFMAAHCIGRQMKKLKLSSIKIIKQRKPHFVTVTLVVPYMTSQPPILRLIAVVRLAVLFSFNQQVTQKVSM